MACRTDDSRSLSSLSLYTILHEQINRPSVSSSSWCDSVGRCRSSSSGAARVAPAERHDEVYHIGRARQCTAASAQLILSSSVSSKLSGERDLPLPNNDFHTHRQSPTPGSWRPRHTSPRLRLLNRRPPGTCQLDALQVSQCFSSPAGSASRSGNRLKGLGPS
jgi:hypothetical protein